jgi:hypothetical protein
LRKINSDLQNIKKKLDFFHRDLIEKNKIHNLLIKKYNLLTENFNQEYTFTEEFTQGNFDGQNINIFHFKGENELKVLLAHEFGHSLGIGHMEDSSSLMYFLMGKENFSSDFKISNEDKNSLMEKCKINDNFYKIKDIYEKINNFMESIKLY